MGVKILPVVKYDTDILQTIPHLNLSIPNRERLNRLSLPDPGVPAVMEQDLQSHESPLVYSRVFSVETELLVGQAEQWL